MAGTSSLRVCADFLTCRMHDGAIAGETAPQLLLAHFGRYVDHTTQCDNFSTRRVYVRCRYLSMQVDGQHINKSLRSDTDPSSVTVEDAVELLKGPTVLGTHPETGLDVTLQTGRFGPYYKHGSLQFAVGRLREGEEANWEHAMMRLDKKAMKLGAIYRNAVIQRLVPCFQTLLGYDTGGVHHVLVQGLTPDASCRHNTAGGNSAGAQKQAEESRQKVQEGDENGIKGRGHACAPPVDP